MDTRSVAAEGRGLGAPPAAAAWILPGAALLLVYAGTFRWMAGRYLAPGSYFGHGFLVPLVSLLLAWRVRGRLASGDRPAVRAGAVFLLSGSLLFLAGAALRVHFVAGASLLPVLFGLVLLLGGREAARSLRFPVLFLGFMVPLPMWVVANLSLKLKLLTAETSLRLANAAGLVAIREGATIHFPGDAGSLLVGDVCGGLRYSVALVALGALMAHLSRAGPAGKAALLLLSVPAAVAANVARVLLLLAIASARGAEAASGRVHDLSGVLVFAVAFALLLGAGRLVLWLGGGRP